MVEVAVFRQRERDRRSKSGESSRNAALARRIHSRSQSVRRAEKGRLTASQSQPKAFFASASPRGVPAPSSFLSSSDQVERAAVKQQPFQDIFVAAQVRPPHPAGLI